MPEHVVVRGDTIYGIARRHHIRYWPNVYFATGNEDFRASHPNPDRIFPGDRITIPAAADIRPMEQRPLRTYRDVPLFSQSPETCWRATAKMLYCRRKQGTPNPEAEFDRLIGPDYRNQTTGLAPEYWRDFYVRRLHMREGSIVSQNDLHFLVATHGPAVMMITGSTGHAVVMAGYDILRGRWFVLNPSAGIELEFADDEIVVGGSSSGAGASPGEARLTGYRPGAATYENMGQWIWILDTAIANHVYYYE
jgi:hypothetical protein